MQTYAYWELWCHKKKNVYKGSCSDRTQLPARDGPAADASTDRFTSVPSVIQDSTSPPPNQLLCTGLRQDTAHPRPVTPRARSTRSPRAPSAGRDQPRTRAEPEGETTLTLVRAEDTDAAGPTAGDGFAQPCGFLLGGGLCPSSSAGYRPVSPPRVINSSLVPLPHQDFHVTRSGASPLSPICGYHFGHDTCRHQSFSVSSLYFQISSYSFSSHR